MKIEKVANYVWNNSTEILIGNRVKWDSNTLKREWFMQNYPNVWEKGGGSGVYWFLLKNKTIDQLKKIKTPQGLPERGTNIPKTIRDNCRIFQENLCEPDTNGMLVIYNGHENNVFARIRAHFALNNDRTTAIGFSKYSISQYDLRVRIFHNKNPMQDLSNDDKKFIQILLGEKQGREAVESCWRAYNGWPVLCKR